MPILTKVKDVMDTNVFNVDANATVLEATKLMLQKGVWSVIVTEKELPVGVVTDHDVMRRCIGKGLDMNRVKIEEIMSSPLLIIDAEASVGDAMAMMVGKNVSRLYIVEKGKVIGRITHRGVLESNLGVFWALSSALA
jgi:signal-transduction protein with cAMP-binding, CBS, and nucleotidyltransferase domain